MPELPGQFLFPCCNIFFLLKAYLLTFLRSNYQKSNAQQHFYCGSIGLNKQIKRVETTEDKIVYAGATHDAFV